MTSEKIGVTATGSALLYGLLSGTAAFAGPASGAPSDVLGEVVVTATKREQRLQDVPASIVAETGEELARRGATALNDIATSTPGLSNPGAAPNQSNLVIRGVTTGVGNALKQGTVSLLYDDIPLDPGGFGAGTTNLRVVDVQRVEVLRGPQGTLFGSGSLSGAVRYVTTPPDLREYRGQLELTGGSISTGESPYDGTLTLNLPILEDRLALRGSVWDFHDGGWIDDPGTGRKDANRTNTRGGRMTLRYRSGALTADLSAMYQTSKDDSDYASLYVTPAGRSRDDLVSDGLQDLTFKTRNALGNLTLNYEADGFSILSSTTFHDRKYDNNGTINYFVPLTTLLNSIIFTPTQPPVIVNGPADYEYHADNKTFSQELRVSSAAHGALRWTAGLFYLHSKNPSGQETSSPLVTPYVGGPTIVDAQTQGTQEEVAGFGEATWTFASAWDLTVGARVSRTSLDYTVRTGGFLPVFSVSPDAYTVRTFKRTDSPVTPHLSLSYRPSTDTTWYVSAGRGFRIGGINPTSGVGGRNSPPDYQPDNLWNYELGVKGRALEGRVAYAAAAYYIDWKNIQVDLQNQIGNYTGNAGRAKLVGLELQADVKAREWLLFGASGTVSRNETRQDVPGLVTATGVVDVRSGDELPAAPRQQFSAYADLKFPLLGRPAYVRASGNYMGTAWTSFAKQGSEFGGFGTADLRAGIQLGQIEVVGWCTNVADSRGRTSAGEPSSAGPVILANQYQWTVRPRTFGLTVRASW